MNTKTITKLLECFLIALDYLLWCEGQNKPYNFFSLISWLETSYKVCQRAENEFYKEASKIL
jgi:hypothetical protein